MREVINISLPYEMAKEVKTTVHREGFMSVSEFFRSLLRSWMEGKLLIELEKNREEIKSGKGKILRSLKDLR